MLAEKDMMDLLSRAAIGLQPLEIAIQKIAHRPEEGRLEIDVICEVSWRGQHRHTFVAEVKARATPRVLESAALHARRLASAVPGSHPLVIVPYLSPSSLEEMEKLGVSAIDLCGNGIVQVPHQLLVVRSGRPNLFRESTALRRVYRGVASIVPRAFASQASFKRVSDIQHFIAARGGRITLATVSKALGRLEEDLIVARESGELRLLQPDKLFSKLQESYQPPAIRTKLAVKSKLSEPELHQRLRRAADELGGRVAPSGVSSAKHLTASAMEPIASFYCSMRPEELVKAASIDPAPQPHFADLELLQTDDERMYFDTRVEGDLLVSSPIQAWLELATGDKRAQQMANELRVRLLTELGKKGKGGDG